MKILMVYNLYYYGTKNLNSSYYFFTDTLIKMGHDVIVIDMAKLNKEGRYFAVGMILMQYIKYWKPDILFTVPSREEIAIPYLLYIKKFTKTISIAWNSDDDRRWENYSKKFAPYYDYMITTYEDIYKQVLKEGYNNILLSQWGCNIDYFYKIENIEKIYDIAFIGAAYGNRPKYIKLLQEAGYKVFVGGLNWDKYIPNSPVELEVSQINLIYNQSKFVLVINEGYEKGMQIKARVFEAPATGSCVLMQRTPNIEKYYSNEDVIFFENETDLLNILEKVYGNEQYINKITSSGYRRTIQEHTYEKRLSLILNQINLSKRKLYGSCLLSKILSNRFMSRLLNKLYKGLK